MMSSDIENISHIVPFFPFVELVDVVEFLTEGGNIAQFC